MNQNPGTEVVIATALEVSAPAKAKKIARVAGAAVFTFAMFGTLALPAYALDQPLANDALANAAPALVAPQTIRVSAAPPIGELEAIPLDLDAKIVDRERLEKELAEAKKLAEAENSDTVSVSGSAAPDFSEVPAGVGGQGIADAARAQLGQGQDCTALVERSLRAAGIPAGDLGTLVSEYVALGGHAFAWGEASLAPGDVLVWNGVNVHVAIYVGNGQVVHGGWTGGTTALVDGFGTIHGPNPSHVVRMV